jgi:hypothetical protein
MDKVYNQYFEKHRHLSHNPISKQDLLEKCFYNNANTLKIYNDTIYPIIQQPYVFSDHKNKTFMNQYNYLKRTHPELWTIDDPAKTFLLSQHNRLGKESIANCIPTEIYRDIYSYSKSEWIIECIAIASHVAFYWHSD